MGLARRGQGDHPPPNPSNLRNTYKDAYIGEYIRYVQCIYVFCLMHLFHVCQDFKGFWLSFDWIPEC